MRTNLSAFQIARGSADLVIDATGVDADMKDKAVALFFPVVKRNGFYVSEGFDEYSLRRFFITRRTSQKSYNMVANVSNLTQAVLWRQNCYHVVWAQNKEYE